MAGHLSLSYNGFATAALDVATVTPAQVKAALEALRTISLVTVADVSNSAALREFDVTFHSEVSGASVSPLAYGDMQDLVVTNLDVQDGANAINVGAVQQQQGVSPLGNVVISSSALSSDKCTAVDDLSPSPCPVFDASCAGGLHSGRFDRVSTLTIEARDRFSNRVLT